MLVQVVLTKSSTVMKLISIAEESALLVLKVKGVLLARIVKPAFAHYPGAVRKKLFVPMENSMREKQI